MNDIAIKAESLSKVYKLYDKPSMRVKEIFSITGKKRYHEFQALNNVSFCLRHGETLGIIGKNGAGKSTLLKIITGVTTPTAGSVQINGSVSALLELGTGFNPEYTGYENIFLNGAMRGFSESEMQQVLAFIVDFADIGRYMEQPVKTYSSGMFARLAFAVMISFRPDILIIDEALSVGDIFFQQKCNAYMKEEMQDAAKILVTHDMNSIANMADWVILLDHGSVVREGRPLEVIQDYLKIMHSEVYKGSGVQMDEAVKSEEKVNKQADETSKSENWVAVDQHEIGGAGEILIEKCSLSINGTAAKIVKPDDHIKIELLIYSKIKPENVICGYTFKDKYGNSIFAQNTLGAGIYINGISKGEYYISLEFQWPEIKEGDYFLTLGIGEGKDQMVHKIQCWAHAVCHVESMSLKPMHGIINHTIDGFRCEAAGKRKAIADTTLEFDEEGK